MAFRQVIINMDGFRATELLNVTSLDYNPGTLWSRPFTDGTDLYSKATSENVPVTLFDTGIFKMVATLTDSLKHLNEKFYYNQNQIINNNSGNRYVTFTGFAFGVDDDTELGTLWICVTADGGEYGVTRLVSPSHDLYLGILSAQPDPNKSGGAGSGYIGNSLLSNKKMVGYNVPTSSAESTKTESVDEASETHVSGKPKIGNGFARIKLLKAAESKGFFDIVSDYNLEISNLVDAGTSDSNPLALMMTAINNPQNRNKIVYGGQSYRKLPTIENGKIKYTSHSNNNYVGTYLAFPLKQDINFHGISAKVTITNSPKGNWEMHRLIDTADDNPIELRFVYNWPGETRNINLNQETELSTNVGEYYTSKSTHIVMEWGYGTWESRDIIITYFV